MKTSIYPTEACEGKCTVVPVINYRSHFGSEGERTGRIHGIGGFYRAQWSAERAGVLHGFAQGIQDFQECGSGGNKTKQNPKATLWHGYRKCI